MGDKILAAIIIGILMWAGTTIVTIDKKLAVIEYKLDQVNVIFQDIYEVKKDKK